MFYIAPNTTIDFLRGVPFDPAYENTMYFDTVAQQTAYFDAKVAITIPNNSYQRVERGWLKVAKPQFENVTPLIKDLYNVNYMRFKNTNFENKWFYAFVDRVTYVNNNTVNVYFHLDVLQTWHFDYTFNQCMIERQHTETDNLGDNLIPENFELGDYVNDGFGYIDYNPIVVVVTAGDMSGTYQPGYIRNGKAARGKWFTGVNFLGFDPTDATQINSLNQLLEDAYTDRDTLNTIISIFMMPQWFFNENAQPYSITKSIISDTGSVSGYHLGAYPVRNAKLMTYPYNMFYVSNNEGQYAEYHFEYFNDPTNCVFEVWGNLSANPGLIMYPINYKRYGSYPQNQANYDERLEVTGFPMCAWANDAFKAWLAQNAGTITAGAVSITAGIIGGAIQSTNYTAGRSIPVQDWTGENWTINDPSKLSFKPNNMLIGSLTAAINAVGKVADHAVQPPQAHGSANGNLTYQAGLMTFMYCHKHIREEFASIIDNFFDMYGYTIHKPGIPNRTARPCYTYVKTTDCSVDGNVPVEDLRLIEQIFNKGVRFWRTTATFGNFDYRINNNAPLT